jgi:hypothetical protein
MQALLPAGEVKVNVTALSYMNLFFCDEKSIEFEGLHTENDEPLHTVPNGNDGRLR